MLKIREILVQRRIEAGAKVVVIANERSKAYGCWRALVCVRSEHLRRSSNTCKFKIGR